MFPYFFDTESRIASVSVKDLSGNPLAGVEVNWSLLIPTGDPAAVSLEFPQSFTNSEGNAVTRTTRGPGMPTFPTTSGVTSTALQVESGGLNKSFSINYGLSASGCDYFGTEATCAPGQEIVVTTPVGCLPFNLGLDPTLPQSLPLAVNPGIAEATAMALSIGPDPLFPNVLDITVACKQVGSTALLIGGTNSDGRVTINVQNP